MYEIEGEKYSPTGRTW